MLCTEHNSMPTLEAEVSDDDLTIVVRDSDGNERERIEGEASMLRQNQQFVSSFERPVLTLLTLYDRERESQEDKLEEIADADIPDLPT